MNCDDVGAYDELTRLNNELVNLQRELAKKNAELARLNELKNQFLGMAAHDLRKLTGLILNNSEFVLDEAGAVFTDEHRGFVETIHSASGRMMRLIDDFLDVSIIESGRLILERQPTDISRVIHDAVELVERIAMRDGIAIEVEAGLGTSKIEIDGQKIEQVVANLLDNAIRHAPTDSVVRVSVRQQDTQTILSVTDQGPGFQEDQLELLFRPYESGAGKRYKGQKGAGLGLVIARKIVEEHAGALTVESSPGEGATFRVTLPTTGVE